MKAKYLFQVVQDAIMVLILLSLAGYHLWSENVHEWLAILFLFFVLLHNSLNFHWFRRLFQGEYPLFRILALVINILLFIAFLSALISGLMMSRYVLPDLPIHNASDLVRKTHMTSVHWLQVIIAVHLGIHWKMLANFLCRIWHISPTSLLARWLMPTFFTLVSFYGLYVFIEREMLPYLLMQVDFAFFDYEETRPAFYLALFAVTSMFAWLTRFLVWLFLFRGKAVVIKSAT